MDQSPDGNAIKDRWTVHCARDSAVACRVHLQRVARVAPAESGATEQEKIAGWHDNKLKHDHHEQRPISLSGISGVAHREWHLSIITQSTCANSSIHTVFSGHPRSGLVPSSHEDFGTSHRACSLLARSPRSRFRLWTQLRVREHL